MIEILIVEVQVSMKKQMVVKRHCIEHFKLFMEKNHPLVMSLHVLGAVNMVLSCKFFSLFQENVVRKNLN